MEFRLIYPKRRKLDEQTTFNLHPHGPVVVAAALPEYVNVKFTDENLEEINFNEPADFIGISMMLTTQVKRGWEIADRFRSMGKKVIFGGIATMLHAEETMQHADAVFLGDAEGRMEEGFNDYKNGTLKKVYNFMYNFPDINTIGPARRDILNRDLYNHKGVQMVDLFHASRGCITASYPRAVADLGGR